jgi:mannitol-specific phosphotransferase system IIBC component
MNHYFDGTAKAGTAGGTLLTIIVNIHQEDLVRTAILAAIGAVVSFVVTVLIKVVIGFFKR